MSSSLKSYPPAPGARVIEVQPAVNTVSLRHSFAYLYEPRSYPKGNGPVRLRTTCPHLRRTEYEQIRRDKRVPKQKNEKHPLWVFLANEQPQPTTIDRPKTPEQKTAPYLDEVKNSLRMKWWKGMHGVKFRY
jgi:hypothetical protein